MLLFCMDMLRYVAVFVSTTLPLQLNPVFCIHLGVRHRYHQNRFSRYAF